MQVMQVFGVSGLARLQISNAPLQEMRKGSDSKPLVDNNGIIRVTRAYPTELVHKDMKKRAAAYP